MLFCDCRLCVVVEIVLRELNPPFWPSLSWATRPLSIWGRAAAVVDVVVVTMAKRRAVARQRRRIADVQTQSGLEQASCSLDSFSHLAVSGTRSRQRIPEQHWRTLS